MVILAVLDLLPRRPVPAGWDPEGEGGEGLECLLILSPCGLICVDIGNGSSCCEEKPTGWEMSVMPIFT